MMLEIEELIDQLALVSLSFVLFLCMVVLLLFVLLWLLEID
jgi:hypothetical protein